MKAMAIAALLAFTAAASAQPAMRPASACLYVRDIDHTHVVDANTLLFYMRNGAIWKNTLAGPCPALKFHGFSFTAHDTEEVCSNAQGIRVIETGQVCALGAFTPYTPPADAGHAAP
jgi:hypothetical protein